MSTTTFLSESVEDEPVQLGQETNTQILYRELVYAATGDCEHGDEPVGFVLIDEADPMWEEKLRMTATFHFTGSDKSGITVTGIVERQGDGKRRGKLGAGYGIGTLEGWKGVVDLDECNPKRWVFEPGPPTGNA